MSRPYVEVFLERPRRDVRMPTAREVRIVQAEYAHEAAVITYVYDKWLLSAATKGKPVTVRWGWPPQTADFVGYVHHVVIDDKPVRDNYPRLMRVVCVGATDPLNQTGFSQYRSARVDVVVADIAREHGFSSLTEHHSFIWPLLQQEGQSVWNFLVAIAKRVGWTLYPRGTDLRCHSRAIRRTGALSFRKAAYDDEHNLDRMALFTFEAIRAETLKDAPSKRIRVARGVDAMGNLFTVTAGAPPITVGSRTLDPKLVEYTSIAVDSMAEAEAILAGEQENNRHHIKAKATVTGDPRLHPARIVRILGMDRDNNGVWYSTRVEHVLTSVQYRAVLELGRDSAGDPSGTRLVRTTPGDTSARPVAASEEPMPVSRYVGDRWTAAVAVSRDLPAMPRRHAVAAVGAPHGVFGGSRG